MKPKVLTHTEDKNNPHDSAPKTDSRLNTTNKELVLAINECFQFANDGKTAVANAINGKGVSASSTETFSSLAGKVTSSLVKPVGTAVASDVVKGKTFINSTGSTVTGTKDLTNLVAGNIKSGVTIGGVTGTLQEGGRVYSGTFTVPANSTTATITGLPFKPTRIEYFEIITDYNDYIGYCMSDANGKLKHLYTVSSSKYNATDFFNNMGISTISLINSPYYPNTPVNSNFKGITAIGDTSFTIQCNSYTSYQKTIQYTVQA